MTSRRRAVQVIAGLRRGGAERLLVRTADGLRDRGWRVDVVSLMGGPLVRELEGAGVPVVNLEINRRGVAASIAALVQVIRRTRPAVLHSWMFHANLVARIAGRLTRVPLIVSSEHTLEQESRKRYLANRLTGRMAHVHICVSRAVADFARSQIRLPGRRLAVIRGGIAVDEYAADQPMPAARARIDLPTDVPMIVSVAQLKSVKRADVLLEGFARLACPAELLLVGDGFERRTLVELASRLQIADRVRFVGEQPDPRPWLHAADVFASASDVEGLGLAVIEAMAAGLPVVATDVGGVPEVVVDGVTGHLVPRRDPEALAAALNAVLDDSAASAQMGEKGRQRARSHFDARRMVAEIAELYENRLGRSP